MANFVRCLLSMEGVADLPIYTIGDGGKKELDFNKIIPMPDTLEVEAGSMESDAIDALAAVINSYKATRVPIIGRKEEPFALPEDKRKLAESGLRYIGNVIRHGAATWYDWRRYHWGTKWNASDLDVEGENLVRFSTPWNPPLRVIEKMAELFPGKKIDIIWADEDVGCNTGHMLIGEDGAVSEFTEYTDNSQEAYGAYVVCWEDNERLEQVNGQWKLVEDED